MHTQRSKNLHVTLFLLVLLLSTLTISLGLQSRTVVPSDGSIYYPPPEQVLFEEDFESGSLNRWTGTYSTTGDNVTLEAINPYQGTYHARYQTGPEDAGVRTAYCYQTVSPAVSQVYARAYFYIGSGLPLTNENDRIGLISFEVNGNLLCTLRIVRSGGLDKFGIVGFDGSSSISEETDSGYPAQGRWYCIEFFARIHSSIGAYRAWIDGVEKITIENVDTTAYGSGINRVRFGLPYVGNVQHRVQVDCDDVVIGTRYIGQTFGPRTFGVITSVAAARNFYWLFGNQSIQYQTLRPSEVASFTDLDDFDALVIWTKSGGYNAAAIRQFASTGLVISDMQDFCKILYPSLSSSMQSTSASTVTYAVDWGNFRDGDRIEMRNETGNTAQLTGVLASGLSRFTNTSTVAVFDDGKVATFRMRGTQDNTGFFVIDLDATTSETEYAGIWHVFPAIKTVEDFPTGKYARWLAKGVSDLTYDEVMAALRTWVRNTPTEMNASLIRIGKSVLGRDINATRFGKGSRYIVIDAAIHGNEKNPVHALLRLLEIIQDNFQNDGYWKQRLNDVSLIVIPILNVDGYVRGTRRNANDEDLNRQFPPYGTTTQPEARALRWVWGNYSTIIYVTLHEGRQWFPSDYFYSVNFTATPVDIKGFAKKNCLWTADEFENLRHWGSYDEEGWSDNPVDIGEVNTIHQRSGSVGQSDIGASYLYNISGYLVESFVWSIDYYGVNHQARQMLWAMDYYITAVLGFTSHLDWLRSQNCLVVTQANIRHLGWNSGLQLDIDTSQLSDPSTSITNIDGGYRTKPTSVYIDTQLKTEGHGWTYSGGIITITGARNSVRIVW